MPGSPDSGMTRRQLPVLVPPSHATARTHGMAPDTAKTRLTVDDHCIAIVCAQGLDAAATWVTKLCDAMARTGVAPALVFDGRRLPLGPVGRALAARGAPLDPAGGRTSDPSGRGQAWILWVDDAYVPEGARCTLLLTDTIPSQAPRGDDARRVYVQNTRLGVADALAHAVAGTSG
ncbi:MAG: hypothetical protein RL385_2075 [Pseudomonadota bacterium]